MPKPIFVIRHHHRNEIDAVIRAKIKDELSDYHILIVGGGNIEVEFECYNCGEVEEITIAELQEKVLKLINESA